MTTPSEARAIADMLQTDIPAGAVEAFRSLADQVEALTAERDKLATAVSIAAVIQQERDSYKKDAERYRAIREGLEVDENSGIVVSLVDDFGGETLDSEVADNAVDAAIAKGTAA